MHKTVDEEDKAEEASNHNSRKSARGQARGSTAVSGVVMLMLGVTVGGVLAEKPKALKLPPAAAGIGCAALIVAGIALIAATFIWPRRTLEVTIHRDERDELIRIKANSAVARVMLLVNTAFAVALVILAEMLKLTVLYFIAAGMALSLAIFLTSLIAFNRYYDNRL
ncbi:MULTISPECIES: hypothetical protein [Bifidobacterium]|jgi:hypothetical protein|uniref:DUF2178 domain-containing protein n=1 Tax=Bifidobacterium tibiigranuli TaxID=2172043 RepID=A0A5N6S3L9_9BIFI|nr:hypothetical protein [Bifidobacterium tibiigranuli]KAE8129080.1 hypothetical protein DDE84_03075 [Bifidobacterium tibiigranuli]KAE8129318.1 hypothetical protein DDF78_02865 [Bifidobacterium tibiigranuli]MCH4203480.1 hypothetical protein [Bifidobacterium tibiigranuli]MCH4273908.1 hypothetical protein [Bifidobacterium tibiigranuli]MCI1210275.1 hypothetical protein [Bifidobacterium tibiigranuli]